jgi:pyruvate,water dikinase
MTYVKALKSITRNDFSSAGGKGANLGEMINAGLPVPDGFVVLIDGYRDFVEKNDLQRKIDSIVKDVRADDVTALQKASKTIGELFEQGTIPDDITSEIITMYNQLGLSSVAVRSSATAEDLPGTSFAGQYNTYLNVSGVDNVLKAVQRCWASLWNARAVSYRLRQDIPLDVPFAVIVQELLDGEKSGIVFTANPVTGRRDQTVINASWGLGESIVGGAVSPDQWIVDKTGITTTISKKEVMTIREKEGTKSVKIPAHLQEKPVLTQKEIGTLVDLAQKTEQYFGSPQDIEWVYTDTFYFVQTRPITSLFPLPEPLPEPEKGLRVYLSLNFAGQGITEPLTPMGMEAFRLLYYGFSVLMWGSRALKYPDWVKTAAGRVFLDLTNLLGTKIGDAFVRGIAGKDPDTEKALNQFLEKNEGLLKKGRVKIPVRLVVIGLQFTGMIVRAMINPASIRKKMLTAADERINSLQTATLQGVDERLTFIEKAAIGVMKMELDQSAAFSTGFIALDRAEQLLEKWLGDQALVDPVRQSLPYNPTTQMSLALLEISQQLKEQNREPSPDTVEVQTFLKEYGHRAVLEIDMGLSRWKEDPSYVCDIITMYMEGDPLQKIEKFKNGAKKGEEAITNIVSTVRLKKSVVHAWIIKELLCCYRELAGLRERPKFDLVRSFSVFRDILKDVGKELVLQGRLSTAEDIFFVTFSDIRGGGDLHSVAAKNKKEYERELKRKVVPRLMTSTGESMYAAAEEEKALTGVPVSPGVYEGDVRVIHHPRGAHLEPGEILVTRSTDPAWTPLFINAGALIMETGGPISHGSIVAREYGIPAVANVAEATTRLKTGQRIRVNGVSGEIVVLE